MTMTMRDCAWVLVGVTITLTLCGVATGCLVRDAYKEGYTMSLVNQEKGTPHDFILEEKDNGEFVWVANKEGKWE